MIWFNASWSFFRRLSPIQRWSFLGLATLLFASFGTLLYSASRPDMVLLSPDPISLDNFNLLCEELKQQGIYFEIREGRVWVPTAQREHTARGGVVRLRPDVAKVT